MATLTKIPPISWFESNEEICIFVHTKCEGCIISLSRTAVHFMADSATKPDAKFDFKLTFPHQINVDAFISKELADGHQIILPKLCGGCKPKLTDKSGKVHLISEIAPNDLRKLHQEKGYCFNHSVSSNDD